MSSEALSIEVSSSRGRRSSASSRSTSRSSASSGWFGFLSEDVKELIEELDPSAPSTPAVVAIDSSVSRVSNISLAALGFKQVDFRHPPPPPPNPPPAILPEQAISLQIPPAVFMDHRNGTCDPCIFYSSVKGCSRGDLCPYCHAGGHYMSDKTKAVHRPRKQTRDKYKAVVQKLLAQIELNPEQVHEELQSEARKSPYVRKLLQGYLDGTDTLDADPVPVFPVGYAGHFPPPPYAPLAMPQHALQLPMHQPFLSSVDAPPSHMAIPRPLYGR